MAVPTITPKDAHARWAAKDPDFVLLDCREPEELAVASIPGAVHIPLGAVRLRAGELDASKRIAVFCHLGVRSVHAVKILQRMGFEHAASVAGGIDAWSLEADPSVPRYTFG